MIFLNYSFADLVKTFRDALLASTDIADFCMDNYGRSLVLAVCADDRQMRNRDEAPFIVMVPTSSNEGMSVEAPSFRFEIDLGIWDDEVSDLDGVGSVEMRGFYRLDEFVNLVVATFVDQAAGRNAIADDVSISYNSHTFFPMHIATLSINIQAQAILGVQNTLG